MKATVGDATMTTMDYRATNPLSGEELVIREVINETVDTTRHIVLRSVQTLSEPIVQDIHDETDIVRQSISNHLAALSDRGFVNRHDEGIEMTGGGILFLDIIDSCLTTIPRQELAYCTRSDHPVPVLAAVSSKQVHVTELRTELEDPPSDSTLRRVLQHFAENGWVEKISGEYQITATGEQVLAAYDELAASLTQLIEKAPWFQRLPPEDATVPIQALTDANLVVSNPSSPSSVLATALSLYDRNIDRFRGLCSIYNSVLFKTYSTMHKLNIGPEFEAILDRPTFMKAVESTDSRYVVDESDDPNYDPLVLDRSHTLGIGIYDSRKVAIGAYNKSGKGQHIAMIVSTNEQVVDWATDLYESYRAEAKRPSEIEPILP
ncbi:transcriptional regulator FilR1 domain-containing protein [Haladaptatus sp. R4]|uniref:transcriptional regulator FilR1 domain-containing protein n=1 Tax=Haladaptatus sp. R4 TaxID=1679489 RepID=UPI000B167273|nr:transcriptional regulator FilR1 domain-containing protein [Haladaptatus sp. R4]